MLIRPSARWWLLALVFPAALTAQAPRSPEYAAVQAGLARGWNSWDVHSVAAQVLLPEGFTLRVGLKDNSALNNDGFLADPLIGRIGGSGEEVFPGPHTWNGSYTELRLSWRGHQLRLQTAHDGDDLVMLVTPLPAKGGLPPTLVISTGVLWDRSGGAARSGDHLELRNDALDWRVLDRRRADCDCTARGSAAFRSDVSGPRRRQHRPAANARRDPDRLESRATDGGLRCPGHRKRCGLEYDLRADPVARDLTREPAVVGQLGRVCPVRLGHLLRRVAGGGRGSRPGLRRRHRDAAGGHAGGLRAELCAGWRLESFDRSEPPVGAITVLDLYRKFHDAWFLRDTFEPLLRWNRWWSEHRDFGGYLVWGTDVDNRPLNPDDHAVGTLQGAKYESGLDNSPMYDTAPFDANSGRMLLADVGLMGLYVADCDALATIADELGSRPEAQELRERGERYRAKLRTMWDEPAGMFLNKDLATGKASARLSPTNFYPLLARAATPEQAGCMVREHLLNPREFWGDWVLPSIARSDPAFRDQEYWRGRVWGPMNFLVYLGLRHYDQPAARQQLAQRSLALFEKEWREQGHVHENYNAVNGSGDDVTSSDRFYHWGALLGLIAEMENGAGPGRTTAPAKPEPNGGRDSK